MGLSLSQELGSLYSCETAVKLSSCPVFFFKSLACAAGLEYLSSRPKPGQRAY